LTEIIIRTVTKSDYQIIKKLVKELYDTLDEKIGMVEHLPLKKFEENSWSTLQLNLRLAVVALR